VWDRHLAGQCGTGASPVIAVTAITGFGVTSEKAFTAHPRTPFCLLSIRLDFAYIKRYTSMCGVGTDPLEWHYMTA